MTCLKCEKRETWRTGAYCFSCLQAVCCSLSSMRRVKTRVPGQDAYTIKLVGKKCPPARCPLHGRGRRGRGLFV